MSEAARQPGLNLAFCGQAKHGKSTLAGRIAYELGEFDAHTMERFATIAAERGKDFNRFNLPLLQSRPATFRDSGVPLDPSRTVVPVRAALTVEETRLTLVDTPGHDFFLNNLIHGLHIADRAVVVVQPIADQSQAELRGTSMVLRILKAFRTDILAFSITKLDLFGETNHQPLFEQTCERIRALCDSLDYGGEKPIVPISALLGWGIRSMDAFPWFSGPSLMDLVLGGALAATSAAVCPMRFTVEGPGDIFSPGSGTVVVGTLESGVLAIGQDVVAEPATSLNQRVVAARVRTLRYPKSLGSVVAEPAKSLQARTVASIGLGDWSRQEANEFFRRGGMLGDSSAPPMVTREIVAEVAFFESDKVYAGKEYTLHANAVRTTVRFIEVTNQELLTVGPPLVANRFEEGEIVTARLLFGAPLCIERVADFPKLSRFVIREQNRIVACGTCLEVKPI